VPDRVFWHFFYGQSAGARNRCSGGVPTDRTRSRCRPNGVSRDAEWATSSASCPLGLPVKVVVFQQRRAFPGLHFEPRWQNRPSFSAIWQPSSINRTSHAMAEGHWGYADQIEDPGHGPKSNAGRSPPPSVLHNGPVLVETACRHRTRTAMPPSITWRWTKVFTLYIVKPVIIAAEPMKVIDPRPHNLWPRGPPLFSVQRVE